MAPVHPVDYRREARAALRARPWTRWADRLPDGRPFRNSVGPVARAALGIAQLGGGARERREQALLAQWLHGNAQGGPEGRGVAWYTFPPLETYALGYGWPSAEGQGLAVSALLRAHVAGGEERHLETARRALPAFEIAVEDGGLRREVEGGLAFEGIPSERPALPLGAWGEALVALRSLAAAGEPEAGPLADAGLAGLRAALRRYRHGSWYLRSLYSVPGPDLASGLDVHRQAQLLAFLGHEAGAPDLVDAARERRRRLRGPRRWRGSSPRARRRDRWVPR